MTDTSISQNIDLSSWDTLYTRMYILQIKIYYLTNDFFPF
jgi:hypothetical protein